MAQRYHISSPFVVGRNAYTGRTYYELTVPVLEECGSADGIYVGGAGYPDIDPGNLQDNWRVATTRPRPCASGNWALASADGSGRAVSHTTLFQHT